MVEIIQKQHNDQDLSQERLYSFDIFDTLVTRTVAEPTGIFSIIEYRLQTEEKYKFIPQILRQNFYEIRINAEGYARAHKKYLDENSQDITFEDIYSYIQKSYNLSDNIVKLLMLLEISLEIDNLYPVMQNINRLKSLYKNSVGEVVLISDMYHSASTIQKMLCRIDGIFNDLKIYVSSEYNKTKSSGDLYKYVQDAENISIKNWTHYGDNIKSDIDSAKSLNISTVFKPQESFMPYEKFLLKEGVCVGDNVFNQMVVGCAKYTRTVSENKSRTYKFGCSFVAPILYPYVNWVIEQAIERNIKTLHFIARDGYILKLIAEEIVKQKRLDIKLNYLYGSRKAWRLPTEETYEDFINYMTSEYIGFMSPDFLATRLNIETSILEKYYGSELPKRVLNNVERENLRTSLLNNSKFKNYIIAIHSDKVSTLRKYFQQEFGEDNYVGVVDLYGTGRTQDMLVKLLYGNNPDKILYSFYFSTTPKRPVNRNNQKLAFFSNKRYDDFWLELFCRTTYGQTIGYRQEGDKIVPIMENINVQNIINWGYESYKQGLIDYTKNIIEVEKRNNISTTSFNTYIKYYHFYKHRLDRDTASIIGDIPYALVGDETNVNACAPEFTKADYKRMLHEGNKDFCKRLSFISFRRSDPKFAKLFERNRKYENFRGYIKHKIIYKLFSIINSTDGRHKEFTILGIKLKFKRRKHA